MKAEGISTRVHTSECWRYNSRRREECETGERRRENQAIHPNKALPLGIRVFAE